MNWPSFAGLFGGADALALPDGLAAGVDALSESGVAYEISVWTVDREIIAGPGGNEARPGSRVSTLFKSTRSDTQLINDRSRDFQKGWRILEGMGLRAHSTGRIADVRVRREKFEGTDMPIMTETLATAKPETHCHVEGIRGTGTATLPEAVRPRRLDMEIEPSAITAMFEFGKHILLVRIGAPLKALVKDYTQRVLKSLNRRNLINPPMIAKVLDKNMTTKWAVNKDRIQVPDFAMDEAVHALSPIITKGTVPQRDKDTGAIKLQTAAGTFTVEGLSSAAMHTALTEPRAITSEMSRAKARDITRDRGRSLGRSI